LNAGKSGSPVKEGVYESAMSINLNGTASGLSNCNQKTLGQRSSGHNRNLTLGHKINYHPTTDQMSCRIEKGETRKRFI